MASSVPFGDIHEGQTVERVDRREAETQRRRRRIASSAPTTSDALNLPMMRGREFTASEEDSPTAPRDGDHRRAAAPDGCSAPRIRSARSIRFGEQTGDARKTIATPMEIVGVAAPIRDELFDREAGPGDLRAVGAQLPRAA